MTVGKPGSFAGDEEERGFWGSLMPQSICRFCGGLALQLQTLGSLKLKMLAHQPWGGQGWHLGQARGRWTPAQGNVSGFPSREAPFRVELGGAVHQLPPGTTWRA